ncbi:MAG: DUF2845 domain-containing protein [Geobacter sp.]|nr:DUF2845 domain-containing protein [Geobacter sp.]
MKLKFAVLATVMLLSSGQVYADNFRCPNGNIVSTGDSIAIVAAKCDPPAGSFKREEPMEIEVSNAEIKSGTKIIYIEVQEWTYNQGSTLLHTLIFRNGVLSEVRTGGFVQ